MKKRLVGSNSVGSVLNNTNEASSSNIQLIVGRNNNHKYVETKTEHRDSCDLIIDEDCDT